MAPEKAADIVRQRVRALIQERGISQTKIVQQVGKGNSWLSGFLSGKSGISFDGLDELARALNVDVRDLFMDRDQIRHASYVEQVLYPFLKEAPHDPAARAAFVRELLEAYELIIAELVAVTTEATTSQLTPAQSPETDPPAGDRARGHKSPRKLKA